MNLFDVEMMIRTGNYADADQRLRWMDHLRLAVTDLRNSDRSPFEQKVYDALRAFIDANSVVGDVP